MNSSGTAPAVMLGGASSGNSAGAGSSSQLQLVYANLLSGAANIVFSNGIKVLKMDSGAIGTAGSIQVGATETAQEVANNLAILGRIAAYCKANGIAIQVDADLTSSATYADGTNALVDQWATPAAQAGLPIASVEDVQEIAIAVAPASFASYASIEVNAIRTLIHDYAGSSYTLTAGNLAIGDMEGGGASSMPALSAWWSAYDAAAAAAGLFGFSYVTADPSWFAPWIDQLSTPNWQAFLEAVSKLAASHAMAMDVVVQGAVTDTTGTQFIQQTLQNGAALAQLQAAGLVNVSNILVRSWDALPVGAGEVTAPDSLANAAAELAAVDPLYMNGSITVQGSVTVKAPAQMILNTGTLKSVGPLSVQWNARDAQSGNRLGVVLIDQTGTLTATRSGTGTVSSLAGNILVLGGNAADLATELNSVRLFETNAGPDTIDIQTFGTQGQLSDNQISVFAASGQKAGSIMASTAQQGWISSAVVLNTGTAVTSGSILTSETLYWSTLAAAGASGPPAFIKTVAIHEPLAEYGVELAPAALLGTTRSAVADVYDPSVDDGAYPSGGYANNWGPVISAAPLSGWLGDAFNPAAELTSLIVQSTTNTFNPISGKLETTVDALAPDPLTVVVNGTAVADTFATAFNNGGTRVTQFNTGDNPSWQAGWGNQFNSVTLTYDAAGQLTEEFFQGGPANPLFTIDDVFNPNNGQLWEQFQSTSQPPASSGSATYATTANPYVPGFATGPLYETQFNTGDNPNWNYNLGTAILSDTEVWTDYFVMANFTGLAVNFPTAYAGDMNAYPYQFVNGHILDLLNLPGKINVNLNALGTVTIDSQTMSSGLAGITDIDAAGATGTVTMTGLAAGGSTLIGGNNLTTINGYGGDTVVAGAGLTFVNSGRSSVLATAGGSTVTVSGNNDIITAAVSCTVVATGTGSVVSFSAGGIFNLGSGASTVTVKGDGVTAWMTASGGAVTAIGNNDQVTGGVNALINLVGNSDTAGTGAGSIVTISGQNDVVYAANANLSVTGTGSSVTVFGNGDTIAAAAGGRITATGTANVINFSQGGTLNLGNGASSATVNGNGATVRMAASGGNITVTGNNDQLTGGVNAIINLTGNGDVAGTGVGSTVTVSGQSELVTATNASVAVSGIGASVTIIGNSDTISAVAGSSVGLTGAGFSVSGSGLSISLASNSSATVNGLNDLVWLNGAGITLFTSGIGPVSVKGSAADVLANIAMLEGLAAAGRIGTITFTDASQPALTLTGAQIVADAAALARIGIPYGLLIAGTGAAVPTATVTAFKVSTTGTPQITLADKTGAGAWSDVIVALNNAGQLVSQHYDWRSGQPFVGTDMYYISGQLYQVWNAPPGGGYVLTQYDITGTQPIAYFVQTVSAGNTMEHLQQVFRPGNTISEVDAYYDVTDSSNNEVFKYSGANVSVQVSNHGQAVLSDTVPAGALSTQSLGGALHFIYGSAASPNLQASSIPDEFIIQASPSGTNTAITISGFDATHDIIALNYAKFGAAAQIATETHSVAGGALITCLDGSCKIMLAGINATTLTPTDFLSI